MIIRILTAVSLCLAQPALADVPERLEAAFTGWAQQVGAKNAIMTIRKAGQVQRDVAVGWAPDMVVETASLSKAITAVCVAHLIDSGVWSADTTSKDVLGKGIAGITIGALLTHTSGLGPDQTQASMMWWLDRSGRKARDAALRALERDTKTATSGSYSYNNENYAVLGAMIEVTTKEAYEDYCAKKVLEPAGVSTARPSARTQRFLPWGGWEMTVQDYAAFHWHAFGPEGIIGSDPSQWPSADLGGGVQYGMGMFQRAMRGTHNYWHFGALCFPGRFNIGSYAVIWLDGYSVAAAYDICPSWDDMNALDSALVGEVFQ